VNTSNPSPNKNSPGQRTRYVKPALVHYGRLSELTLANAPTNWEQNCGNARESGTRKCSERHTKENIRRVGTHPLGFGLYQFEYRAPYRDKWGHGGQFGVMVDEVEPIVPEAISLHPDGYKLVDYALLGIAQPLH